MRALQDPSLAVDSTQTASLLSDEDVKNALVLAIILEQRSALHIYDPSLLDQFIAPPGIQIEVGAIEKYLEMGGTADPADLMLILYGFEEFQVHQALAQALYASADLLALRYLDYFHIVEVVNFIEETVQSGIFMISDLLSKAFGEDPTAEQVMGWLKEKMIRAGFEESTYRYLWTSPIDWNIEVGPEALNLYNSTGGRVTITIDGSYSLDVDSVDLLSSSFWKNTYRSYQLSADQLAGRITGLFKDIAKSIASGATPIVVVPSLDPFDGSTPMQSLSLSLNEALDTNQDWFTDAACRIQYVSGPDPLGEAMCLALESNSGLLFDKDVVLRNAFCSLTDQIYKQLVAENQELRDAPHETNLRSLRMSLQSTDASVWSALENAYREDTEPVLQMMRSSFLRPGEEDYIYKCFIIISSGLLTNALPIEEWTEGRLQDMTNDILAYYQMNGMVTNVTLPSFGVMDLKDGDGGAISIQIRSRTSFEGLSISITDPVRGAGQMPSVHITDLLNGTISPFQATWGLAIKGSLSTYVSVASPSGQFPQMSQKVTTPIESDLRFCVVSGWPLAGIEYKASNTISGDFLALLKQIWAVLSNAVSKIANGAAQVLQLVVQAVQEQGRLAQMALELAMGSLESFMDYVRDFSESLIVDGLGMLLETLTGGRSCSSGIIDFLGVKMGIELNQGDLALATAKNIVKITVGFAICDSAFSISGRIIKIGDGYQLLVNGTFRTPGSRLTLVIDPFMTAFSHFIEVRGWADGTYVEMNVPEVRSFTTFKFSLHDIPGIEALLSNIPTPLPPLKMSLNAGISVNLATGGDPHPVINEFDSNPSGPDAGKEWVEIFNPSDQVISLSGWSLQTTHGMTRLDDLGDIILLPYSRVIYTLSGQALDNGDPKTFPYSDSLALLDAEGKRIDVAPTVMDKKNDGRTWQRADDGSEQWEFRTSTKGTQNSHVRYGQVDDVNLASMVTGLFGQVIERCEASGWTLESLSYAMKTTLIDFQRDMIEAFSESITQIKIFIDIALKDPASVGGIGQTYSIILDSSIIMSAWEWTCQTISEMIVHPLDCVRSLIVTLPPKVLFEHIWFSIQTYAKVETPKLLKSCSQMLGGVVGEAKLTSNVRINLASIGMFIGKDLGKPKLEVGVSFEMASSKMKIAQGSPTGTQVVDAWLFKIKMSKA
ncbi:MAG: hypothetical protein A4E32_01988 [Methanomassiliicoccales archaeon PtaU1.Bin124]|nr:MAG: hypothetical protein A4E32_01988 [Methanomassiliicoccales archaeon PtaU1.Bin124]